MAPIHVCHLAPADCWDTNMLNLLFSNELWDTGLEFTKVAGYPKPTVDGAVVIVPGRYWLEKANQISEVLSRFKWVLCIRTSDEEDLFDTPYQIVHNNIKHWVQTPRTGKDYGDARLFGVGYTPHFNQLAKATNKTVDVFMSCQNTHQRRKEAFAALGGRYRTVHATDGFTHGMGPSEYAANMVNAKIAPAPAGPASPDSFRLYEALEAHCVPIADDVTPGYNSAGYWNTVFSDAPFPILTDYESLPGYIDDQLKLWPANANRIAAWWMRYKRLMAHWLVEDLTELGAL